MKHTRYKDGKTARDIAEEIYQWKLKNTPFIDKIGLGIVQEMGEFAENMLWFREKSHRYTGLGKTERLSAYYKDQCDAIADAMIFLLGLARTSETFLSFEEMDNFIRDNIEQISTPMITLGSILGPLAQILVVSESYNGDPIFLRHFFQRMLNSLGLLAFGFGFDPIQECLMPTWRKVAMRNYNKYPKTGCPEKEKLVLKNG